MSETPSAAAGVVRFGPFEFDRRTLEVRKNGFRLNLNGQPLQLLMLLLERPGELVTREALRQRLWPADTHVDFEHGLNTVVKRLRDALGDTADAPRFVETVPRQGHRFVAAVSAPVSSEGQRVPRRSWLALLGSLTVLAALLTVSAWLSNAHRPAQSSRPRRISSLAVLPLKNLTGDAAQDYFDDGMTDALSTTLSQLGGLTIVSSTSSRRYKDSATSAANVARELGVDAVLEGAVLRTGSHVRVSVALIDGVTDRRLWAGSYDRDLTEVLALHAEIAQTVARELSLVLTDSQRARLAHPGAVQADAYDEYLRGTYFVSRGWAGGCQSAERHFLRAIELDPGFARTHAELVWCYVFPDRLLRPVAELAPKARALTARAIQLDPTLGTAYVGLGLIRQFIDYDWDEAERAFRHALELDPGSASAHTAYGDLLYMRRRGDESVAMHRRALQLDPFSLDRNLGFAFGLINLRRYDDAVQQLNNTLELDPTYAIAQRWLAQTLELKGQRAEAVTVYLGWLDQVLVPDRAPQVRATLEAAYARSGWRAFWRRELALAEAEADHPGTIWKPQYARYSGPCFMAERHARLGDRDIAVALLEKAYDARHHLVASLAVNPVFDSVRSEPRFQVLVRRVGPVP